MNKVILAGRLTRDPEVRYTTGPEPTAVARYTLAVSRRASGESDFISCVAFGKNGEFADKYLKCGIKIGVSGRIQTGSYTNKDGKKVYTTEVVVEEHEFMESSRKPPQEIPEEFTNADNYEDMPFRWKENVWIINWI